MARRKRITQNHRENEYSEPAQDNRHAIAFRTEPYPGTNNYDSRPAASWKFCGECGSPSGYMARLVGSYRGWIGNKGEWERSVADIKSASACISCSLVGELLADDIPDETTIIISTTKTMSSGRHVTIYRKPCVANDGLQTPWLLGTLCIERHGAGLAAEHKMNCWSDRLTQGLFPPMNAKAPDVLVNMRNVSEWIRICEQQHGHQDPSVDAFQNAADILLVNVKSHSLVKSTTRSRYLALSYVWGEVPAFQTTTENLTELQSPEAFKNHLHKLPRVVRDALECVKHLNETYLWVDALCIVQDDPSEKHNQISQMGDIYRNAHLTIVAESSETANSPLPGLCLGTRLRPSYVFLDGSHLKNLSPIDEFKAGIYLEAIRPPANNNGFRYGTRGWTFQEELLSRRCLYFKPHNICFQCASTMEHDQTGCRLPSRDSESSRTFYTRLPVPLISENRRMQFLLKAVDCYTWLIENYRMRNLRYASDTLNAVQGVMSVLNSRMGSGELLCGVPEDLLDYALLWKPKPQGPAKRDPNFPSWSWAGWDGQIVHSGTPFKHVSCLYPFPKLVCETTNRTILRLSGMPRRDEDQDSEGLSESDPNAWSLYRNPYIALKFSTYAVPMSCFSWFSGSLYTSDRLVCGRVPGSVPEAFQLAPEEHEFILLSRYEYERPSQPKMEGLSSKFSSQQSRRVLNIMMVRWVGEYAERVFLATIHESPWNDAYPSIREVRLG